MGEKLSPETINTAMKLIEVLAKDDLMLDKLTDLVREKARLDEKGEPPTSIADQKWEHFNTHEDSYGVYRLGLPKCPDIATNIPTLELAVAIAALPELVKAARVAVKHCRRWHSDSIPLVNISEAGFVKLLDEALEKAGETV